MRKNRKLRNLKQDLDMLRLILLSTLKDARVYKDGTYIVVPNHVKMPKQNRNMWILNKNRSVVIEDIFPDELQQIAETPEAIDHAANFLYEQLDACNETPCIKQCNCLKDLSDLNQQVKLALLVTS
jgi:hypothetical protein